ncbi:MAG: CBS domain-containing protein [Candidatus Bathyarchaeota archaeon]|nr:MAG: CBS domain-containing protein [Candidatus Bathyarchaeota archaeon]
MPVVYAVKHVMSKPLITVDAETSAQAAMQQMVQKDVGALAATEKGQPVGILTERDIMKKCCSDASCSSVKVREIMSAPLITVNYETTLGEAVETMANKDIRRLFVTEKGKIVGIVTQKDLIKGSLIAFHALDLALSSL